MATEHQKRIMRERLVSAKLAVESARQAWDEYGGADNVREARLRRLYWQKESALLDMLLSWAEHTTRPARPRRPVGEGTPDGLIVPLMAASVALYASGRRKS